MILDMTQFLFDALTSQIIVSHLEKKIKLDVVEPDKIGSKFKGAMEKIGMLKDIKGADYIVRFAEKIEAQPEQTEEDPEKDGDPEEDNAEETSEKPGETPEEAPEEDSEEEGSTEEEPAEEAPEEDSEEDSEDEDAEKKDKKVNESMKVQDLTKSMLLPVKGSSKKSSSPKASKASPKKECKKEDKCEKCEKKESEKVEEAETQVTGDELKIKVQKAVAKVFNMDKDKVELVDVPDCVEGYNVYYCKLTFKERENQTEED